MVAIAIFFVVRNPNSRAIKHSVSSVTDAQAINPLDTLSAADIAANASILAGLPETGFIINYADSVRADLTTPTSSNTQIVAKPQILSSVVKTKADIQEYTSVAGDTFATLAAKFGVTSESIKWSNGITTNNLAAGARLVIPPIPGIVYTVKAGDTPESLAAKYKADKDRIVSFNDAEITGLRVDDRIVIPDGSVAAVVSRVTPYYAGFSFGTSAIYGYNGYYAGQCTWWAANRRMAIGRPVPANLGNANRWLANARSAGLPTGRTPAAGAVIWFDPSGPHSSSSLGHVGFVESVSDGTVTFSDMTNYRRSQFTISMDEAQNYWYIY